jgi:glycosyltransferase involved in cell wall biosynthesis
MRILELCLSLGRGGMELYMARSARELARHHEVLPLIHPEAALLREQLEGAGLAPRTWRVGLWELPLLAAWRLSRLLDAERVDAIHAHVRRELPLAALAKAWSRRKPRLVYTSQMKVSQPKTDAYHAFIYGQVDALLTITAQLRDLTRARLRPAQRDRVRLLYYGAETGRSLDAGERAALRAQHGLRDGVFTVGLFGQKHHGKGQHLLAEALHRLRRDGVKAQALLVGPETEPDYVRRVQEQAVALGLEGALHWVGFVPRPQELMQLCDVVVLATKQETFGLVLIEAMNVGVAVVGSDAGGVPEIIDPEETGLLFVPEDAQSLAAQLRRLHDDPALRARLAEAGRRRAAERFSLQRHYEQLEAVLGGALPPEAA